MQESTALALLSFAHPILPNGIIAIALFWLLHSGFSHLLRIQSFFFSYIGSALNPLDTGMLQCKSVFILIICEPVGRTNNLGPFASEWGQACLPDLKFLANSWL